MAKLLLTGLETSGLYPKDPSRPCSSRSTSAVCPFPRCLPVSRATSDRSVRLMSEAGNPTGSSFLCVLVEPNAVVRVCTASQEYLSLWSWVLMPQTFLYFLHPKSRVGLERAILRASRWQGTNKSFLIHLQRPLALLQPLNCLSLNPVWAGVVKISDITGNPRGVLQQGPRPVSAPFQSL